MRAGRADRADVREIRSSGLPLRIAGSFPAAPNGHASSAPLRFQESPTDSDYSDEKEIVVGVAKERQNQPEGKKNEVPVETIIPMGDETAEAEEAELVDISDDQFEEFDG